MTSQALPHKAVAGRPLASYAAYLRPYRSRYLLATIFAFLFVGLSLATPYFIGRAVTVIDTYLSAPESSEGFAVAFRGLLLCAVALVAASIIAGFARFMERKIFIGASRDFEFELRNDYFQHVQSLSRDFFNRTKTGDIMARATNDINFVRMFAGPGIMGMADLVRLPATIGYMCYISPQLTLASLLPLPLVSFFVYRIIMYTHHKSKEVQERFSDVTARAQENLAGAHVVRAYGIEAREERAFYELSRVYMRESIKLAVVQSLLWPIITILVGGTVGIVLWRGGTMVIDGALSLEEFSTFIACLVLIAFPLAEFGWIMSLYQRGAAGMNRLDDIFQESPDISDSKATDATIERMEGGYTFQNVNFAYGSTPVLKDLTFDIPPGSVLGVVGPTGAGKSTLVGLLTRELDPTSGEVRIDALPSKTLPVSILRANIGVVPQDTFLFSDTIENNLRIAAHEASQTQIESACTAAQFLETVERLEEGYDTLLGERGVNLSGGQKQRLAIARALVRDPKVLILDDALSSVDAHTEAAIIDGIRTFSEGRTTVIIAHRLSAVEHADQILVLDEGRIIEHGTHDTLRATGGLYSELWEQQQLEAAIEEAP